MNIKLIGAFAAILTGSGYFSTPVPAQQLPPQTAIDSVRKFIRNSWDKTVRFTPHDEGTLIGMPLPHTVPSISGIFQEMYYWDTYFSNEGLLIDGRTDLARNNAENMLYMVGRFGKMLNGNRQCYINRSQPPYLSLMIRRVYETTGDREWLARMIPGLEKEYSFWMTQRTTPCGLNRYGNEGTEADKLDFVGLLHSRFGESFRSDTLSHQQRLQVGSHYIAEAESGWDFNPRFETRCEDFCPIDLNANMYLYEKNFEFFSRELGDRDQARIWAAKAEKRRKLIRNLCRDPHTGIYFDYDHVNNRRSRIVSAAGFSLLFAKAVSQKDAAQIAGTLRQLEYPYGIAACEDKPYPYKYQWSYPNGWAPLHYLAVRGLDNYGFKDDARRIAAKYVGMVTRTFAQTHNMWEKYNVVEGNINVSNEYEMPTMIGWTAGTFLVCAQYLQKNQ